MRWPCLFLGIAETGIALASNGVFDKGVEDPERISPAFGTNGCAVIAAHVNTGVLAIDD